MRGRISIRQKERKKQGVLRKDIETARALPAALLQRMAAETELHPQRRMGIPNEIPLLSITKQRSEITIFRNPKGAEAEKVW